jgi:endonuclease/exonuclease/phosphatase family metal-dependent hydrolase
MTLNNVSNVGEWHFEKSQSASPTHLVLVNQEINVPYRIVSWNIATKEDYKTLCYLKSQTTRYINLRIVAISAAALPAIALLAAGGLLVYLKVNTIFAAEAFFAIGGALAIGDLIAAIIIYRGKKGALTAAYHKLCSREGAHLDTLSKKEEVARTKMFKQAFQQFGNPDIICLQETWQTKTKDWEAVLPDGYAYYTHTDDNLNSNCTVVWNVQKFTKIAHASITYDGAYIDPEGTNSLQAPDTAVLLRDKANGTLICVNSVHLSSFPSGNSAVPDERGELALQKAAGIGHRQAEYDLNTMAGVDADLYIFAGDFNANANDNPQFEELKKQGYVTDNTDTAPTVYDARLSDTDGRAPISVKMDYIYAKAASDSLATVKQQKLKRTPLDNMKRPSDHIPIGAEVTLTRSSEVRTRAF